MERVVKNRAFTLSKTFYTDGVAATPTGTPTLTLTRSDGTTVTISAVTGTGTGPFQVTVTAANNQLLDTLTATWAAVLTGQSSTYVDTVEVAGDTLFTIADLAADVATSTAAYTAAQIADARTYAETQLETACGVAFVPRYSTYRGSGEGGWAFRIPRTAIRTIRSVTIDGTALSAPDLAALQIGEGMLYGRCWTCGHGNIVVGFEHGLDYPPPGAAEAARVLAKHQLVKGPIDERATQRASEFGPVNLATPGMFGSRFGIPVVDAFVTGVQIPMIA